MESKNADETGQESAEMVNERVREVNDDRRERVEESSVKRSGVSFMLLLRC